MNCWNFLKNVIFPAYCLGCNIKWEYLCKKCKKTILPHPEICPFCHKYSKDFYLCINCLKNQEIFYNWIIIWFRYIGLIKKIILGLKYYHLRDYWNFLSERLKLLLETNEKIKTKKNIILTDVPSHRFRRYFIKWYNQSEILAKNLSKISWLSYKKLLYKSKYNKSQISLTKEKRINNVKWAYKLIKNIDLNWDELIIIIDDIVTTWSTINEIAKILKNKHKNLEIWWLVIWRH